MAEVLGRVARFEDGPRGADVSLQITVAKQWLHEGSTIEIDLPRNLTCASCDGSGCQICDQSGAISVRLRVELPEVISVSLPRSEDTSLKAASGSSRTVVIRIPDCGGPPGIDAIGAARGMLLLAISPGDVPSSFVRLASDRADALPRARALPRGLDRRGELGSGPGNPWGRIGQLVISLLSGPARHRTVLWGVLIALALAGILALFLR